MGYEQQNDAINGKGGASVQKSDRISAILDGLVIPPADDGEDLTPEQVIPNNKRKPRANGDHNKRR